MRETLEVKSENIICELNDEKVINKIKYKKVIINK